MRFGEFNNILINNAIGCSPVGEDTKLLARHAGAAQFSTALDMGTGTGFIPIYLLSLGRLCEGADNNERALVCAKQNAELNHVQLNVFISDLFDHVINRYDLITFNPPYGNVKSRKGSRLLEIIKSLLPKENRILSSSVFFFVKKSRAQLIRRFLAKLPYHLNPGGTCLLVLHASEIPLLNAQTFNIVETYKDLRVVKVSPSRS